MARECFTLHDKAFSTRPAITASKLLGYHYAAFGFAPYGPYWLEMRKITAVELLSHYRLDMFKHIWISEVQTSIKELYMTYTFSAEHAVLVDMKDWFKNLKHNITFRTVTGRRFFGNIADGKKEQALHSLKFIWDFLDLFGTLVLSDAILSLYWLERNSMLRLEDGWRSINRRDFWVEKETRSRIS